MLGQSVFNSIKLGIMKTLVIITALVACCTANPGLGYNALLPGLGWAGQPLIGGSGVIAARTLAAPGLLSAGLIGAPAVAAAPAVVAARTAAIAAPAIATPAIATHGLAATGLLATRTAAFAAPAIAHAAIAAPAVAHAAIAAPAIAAAPVVAARTVAAPAVVAAAPAVTKSQWHSQTELGQASYGHAEPLQTHSAVQDAHGNKVGSFSYVNPHDGQVHRTDYVADALGYRVAANDLPVDTPAVALAKSAHLAAHLRARRGLGYAALATPYAAPALLAHHAIAAPAAYPAVLTTIVNNPGHAVSYRID